MFEVTIYDDMDDDEYAIESQAVVIADDMYGAAINAASALVTQFGFVFCDMCGNEVQETENDNLPIIRTTSLDVFQWGTHEAFTEIVVADHVELSPRRIEVHDPDSDCYVVKGDYI